MEIILIVIMVLIALKTGHSLWFSVRGPFGTRIGTRIPTRRSRRNWRR